MSSFSSLTELFEARIKITNNDLENLASLLVDSIKKRMYNNETTGAKLKDGTIRKKRISGSRFATTKLIDKAELVEMIKYQILRDGDIKVGLTNEDHYSGISAAKLAKVHQEYDMLPNRKFLFWTEVEEKIVTSFLNTR